jgi:hypothetical protein
MSRLLTPQKALQIYEDTFDQYFDELLGPTFDSISGGLVGRSFAGYGYREPEYTFGFWSNFSPWRFVDREELGLVIYRMLRDPLSAPIWLSFPFSDVDVSKPQGPYPTPGAKPFLLQFANALEQGGLRQDKKRVRGRFIKLSRDISVPEYRRTPPRTPIYLGVNSTPSSEGDGRV